jgi:hypothetical protein
VADPFLQLHEFDLQAAHFLFVVATLPEADRLGRLARFAAAPIQLCPTAGGWGRHVSLICSLALGHFCL